MSELCVWCLVVQFNFRAKSPSLHKNSKGGYMWLTYGSVLKVIILCFSFTTSRKSSSGQLCQKGGADHTQHRGRQPCLGPKWLDSHFHLIYFLKRFTSFASLYFKECKGQIKRNLSLKFVSKWKWFFGIWNLVKPKFVFKCFVTIYLAWFIACFYLLFFYFLTHNWFNNHLKHLGRTRLGVLIRPV